MAQPTFFEQPPPSTLAEIAALTKAHLVDPDRAGQTVRGSHRSTRRGRRNSRSSTT